MGRQSDARERLVQAAVQLIYARSYSAVGVQEICARAGVQKGSFYHFFPSKRDLTIAALDELWRGLQERVVGPAFARDVPPLARIERFFDQSARVQREFMEQSGQVLGCPLGNLALEMSTQDPLLRARIEALFQAAEQQIAQTLEEARQDGSAPDIDPAGAARALFAYMEGVLLMAKTRNDPECIRELGRNALALVCGSTQAGARIVTQE